MLAEFKKFLMRGNVIDLAVAVVIGAAFSAVINSFVDDIINPIIGLVGGQDFSDLAITLKEAEGADPRSEEHTSELQSLMRISYAVFCLKKKTHQNTTTTT